MLFWILLTYWANIKRADFDKLIYIIYYSFITIILTESLFI